MAVPNFVLVFVVAWIFLYIFVYYVFMSPDEDKSSVAQLKIVQPEERSEYIGNAETQGIEPSRVSITSDSDIFLTEECKEYIASVNVPGDINHVSMIIVARDVTSSALIRTVIMLEVLALMLSAVVHCCLVRFHCE